MVRIPEAEVARTREILYSIPDAERKERRAAMARTVHALTYNDVRPARCVF